MIYEFALEPELVASWHDRAAFRFFDGKFGIGTSRAPSRFPRDQWEKLVTTAFEELDLADELARQRGRKMLDLILPVLRMSTGAYREGRLNGNEGWVTAARAEQLRRPFHAVITQQPVPGGPERFLVADDLEEQNELWSPPVKLVPRDRASFAAALAPMLRCAKTIKLVDPFFNPSLDKWRKAFEALVAAALEHRGRGEQANLEIHTSASRRLRDRNGSWDPSDEGPEAARILAGCRRVLPDILPANYRATIFIWSEKNKGPDFHDRFVLTNVGGVSVGHGLDAHGPEGANDVITLLSRQQFDALWRRFQASSTDYRSNHKPEVVGSRPPRSPVRLRRL